MSADVIACAVLLFVFVLGFLCGYGKAMEPERKAAEKDYADMRRMQGEFIRASSERDEARGTNERWERIKALTDTVRLDTLWQELVAQRDKFKRERDEALAALRVAKGFINNLTVPQNKQEAGWQIVQGMRVLKCIDAVLDKHEKGSSTP
jgi:hypothetical protein